MWISCEMDIGDETPHVVIVSGDVHGQPDDTWVYDLEARDAETGELVELCPVSRQNAIDLLFEAARETCAHGWTKFYYINH